MAISNEDLNKYKSQWNNMSYDQQQALLKSNSKLGDALNKLGVSVKTNNNSTNTQTFTQYGGGSNGDYTKGPINVSTNTPSKQTNTSSGSSNSNDTFNQFGGGSNGDMYKGPINLQKNSRGTTTPVGDANLSNAKPVSAGTGNTFNQFGGGKGGNMYEGPLTIGKQNNATVVPNKTPTQTTTPTKQTGTTGYKTPTRTVQPTPQQQQWDYQDNSQARLDQIEDNLNKYSVTNPELFKDYETFYNFFIYGKGRSEDQIRALDNYYANYKRNEKYGNMTPEDIGSGIANGEIPADYINDVAAKDPNKAEAIKAAMHDTQDAIANEASLASLSADAGLGDSDWWKWNYKEMGYRDENKDGLDDRLYHEATEEERGLVDERSKITAELLKIHNAKRDAIDNAIEQYPDIDYSTALLIANDRNRKLDKQADQYNISLAQINGTLEYLQSERQQMDQAGQNTINELQKQYGMYMQYSPEGIAQMAQAQYGATHISLDQANNGTYTQKQMALDNVLQGYYDKYGSIIQRSQQQVVNDVIAYAEKNGVSLSQALEENFLKPLRSKPQFATISAGQQASGVQWTKIGKDADGNDVYGFVNTDTMTVSPYGSIGGGVGGGTGYTVSQINNDRGKRVEAMANMARNYDDVGDMANAIAQGMNGMGDGDYECGAYTNDYIWAVTGNKGGYGNSIQSKIALTDNQDWDGIQIGDAIVFDYNKNTPQWVLNSPDKAKLLECGHVGFVTGKNGDGSITISHTNGGKVTETTIAPGSSFYNSFAGSQHIQPNKTAVKGFNEQWENEYLEYFKKPGDIDSIAKRLGLSQDQFREQANRYSWSQTADTYYDVLDKIDTILGLAKKNTLPTFWERQNALADSWYTFSTLQDNVADWKSMNDRIISVLGLDSLINLKGQGATFGALSDSERLAINNYATSLGNAMSDEEYVRELNRLRDKLVSASHGYLSGEKIETSDYDWTAGI